MIVCWGGGKARFYGLMVVRYGYMGEREGRGKVGHIANQSVNCE